MAQCLEPCPLGVNHLNRGTEHKPRATRPALPGPSWHKAVPGSLLLGLPLGRVPLTGEAPCAVTGLAQSECVEAGASMPAS